jgi:V/A-type H+-transporting ATPase subunit D
MAKIKLTKNELKKQKDALTMYKRYLPTLQLKKQQLQTEIRGIETRAKAIAAQRESLMAEFRAWIAVFGEESAIQTESGEWLLSVREIRTTVGNIAGVEEIPCLFRGRFSATRITISSSGLSGSTKPWNGSGHAGAGSGDQVLEEQIAGWPGSCGSDQRVNLFEKVKIRKPRRTSNGSASTSETSRRPRWFAER